LAARDVAVITDTVTYEPWVAAEAAGN